MDDPHFIYITNLKTKALVVSLSYAGYGGHTKSPMNLKLRTIFNKGYLC
jgi:hypothetical protein